MFGGSKARWMVPWPGLDADDKKGLDIAALSMNFYGSIVEGVIEYSAGMNAKGKLSFVLVS